MISPEYAGSKNLASHKFSFLSGPSLYGTKTDKDKDRKIILTSLNLINIFSTDMQQKLMIITEINVNRIALSSPQQ